MQTAAKLLGDATEETYHLFGGDLVDKFSLAMKNSLVPGPFLDAQNLRMGKRAVLDIDALVEESQSGIAREIPLLDWIRHAVVQASSCGVFGNNHPFCDPAVETAFW